MLLGFFELDLCLLFESSFDFLFKLFSHLPLHCLKDLGVLHLDFGLEFSHSSLLLLLASNFGRLPQWAGFLLLFSFIPTIFLLLDIWSEIFFFFSDHCICQV